MLKKSLVLFFTVLILSGCSNNKPDRTINSIFNDYYKLNKELSVLDKEYAGYLTEICPGNESIKLDNADNLFNAVDNWKLKRKNIFNNYASILFNSENTTIKEFKHQFIVDELIKLTSNFVAAEELIDYTFLQNPDCQTKYTYFEDEYRKPVETKTCVISCYELQRLAKNIISLSEKGDIIIQNARISIKNNYTE
ncbi:MAG: hypothetical protein AB7V50_11205 [Vampirovibrionia bacterium]